MWGAPGINLCQEARQSKPHLMHCTGWGYDTYGDRNALTYIVSSSPQPPPTSEKLDPTFDCLDILVDWGLVAADWGRNHKLQLSGTKEACGSWANGFFCRRSTLKSFEILFRFVTL